MEDTQRLHYLVNHVFMPPKTPQEDDYNAENDEELCGTILKCAENYVQHLPADKRPLWWRVVGMLRRMRDLHVAKFNTGTLKNILFAMDSGDTFAALIRAQNAGIVFRMLDNEIIFECFEASPTNKEVLECTGKLLCSFPGPAVSFPRKLFKDDGFLTELASFLSQMNIDVFKDAVPQSRKAGISVEEDRDTVDPKYITQLLTGILRGLDPQPQELANVPRVCKRIADDVLWLDARLPWRRSPLWLVIRVALQTTLMREDPSHLEYKKFIAFVLSEIIRRAVRYPESFDNDLLFSMRAKLCQRSQKLGETIAGSSLWEEIQASCGEATKLMETRWEAVQKAHAQTSHWDPSTLRIEDDTRLALAHSRECIRRALDNEHPAIPRKVFHPNDGARLRDFTDLPRYVSEKQSVFNEDPHLVLEDFELAVSRDLASWTTSRLTGDSDDTTSILLRCMTEYHAKAHKLYASSPEDISMMLLTLFELWMALDRIATTRIPLLKDYPPEMDCALLESLLLRKSRDLSRLRPLREYVKSREAGAFWSSIFCDPYANSFAVRYFDQTRSIQGIKADIEKDAAAEKFRKLEELEQTNEEYRRLTRERDRQDHSYHFSSRWTSGCCVKCNLDARIRNLSIHVHEWPLPQDELVAKTVVFELNCPAPFSHWREATCFLLNDVCSPSESGEHPHTVLPDYGPLSRWRSPDLQSRIMLASTAKPFIQSHYGSRVPPSDASSVCVPNGLRWRLYDNHNATWLADWDRKADISALCTFQLPKEDARYSNLQYAINSTSATPNETLSQQCECSTGISLHEYASFTHLRSGGRLQWMNILHSFVERALSFQRDAVHMLFLQAALQVGCFSSDHSLEWHQDLNDDKFGKTLLEYMGKLVDNVLGNWQEVVTVETVVLLTTRLLGASPPECVVQGSVKLLRRVRSGMQQWIQDLQHKLSNSDKPSESLRQRILHTAAVCRATYDVDDSHLPLLLSTAKDVMAFVECGIIIHDNGGWAAKSALFNRDRRLAHNMVKELCMQRWSEGFSGAVKAIWTSFDPSSAGWTRLDTPNDCWMTCNTSSKSGSQSQVVHLNVLRGTLLIDGTPLSRLPVEITKHSIYQQFLGRKILDVVPSNMPEMEFMTRREVSGYQLYFTRRRDGVVIRAQQSNSESHYELLPRAIFTDDLPFLFVEDYFHWLHLKDRRVELRDSNSLWTSSHQGWSIDISSSQMRNGIGRATDINSDTFKMISARLAPLEDPRFMHLVYNSCGDSKLRAHLPRLKLSFLLDKGELLSEGFENMIVDSNGSSGTMVGLKRQLVLIERPHTSHVLPQNRCVLIPIGRVSFCKDNEHVCVNIENPQEKRHIRYLTYSINTELQRLDGSGSLESTLYKIYLHALTSSCLPDPLTQRTGTIEALILLYSPASISFQQLHKQDESLLEAISKLTPCREYYPQHLKTMQTVCWRPLHVLSQSEAFDHGVRLIFSYAQHLGIFEGSTPDYSTAIQPSSPVSLLHRAGARKRMYYPPGPTWLSTINDTIYHCRDAQLADEAIIRGVCRALIHHDNLEVVDPQLVVTLVQSFDCWGQVHNAKPDFSLSYHRTFLDEEPSSLLLPFIDRIIHGQEGRFSHLFSICAFAFRAPDRHLLPYLVAFSSHSQFATAASPSWSSYDLSYGYLLHAERLRNCVAGGVRDLRDTPSYDLRQSRYESFGEFEGRQRKDYESKCQQSCQCIVEQLKARSPWPCQSPTLPPSTQYHDMSAVSNIIKDLYLSWYKNYELHEYLTTIHSIFRSVCSSVYGHYRLSVANFTPCSTRTAHCHDPQTFTFSRIMQTRRAPLLCSIAVPFPEVSAGNGRNSEYFRSRLGSILDRLSSNGRPLQRNYVSVLRSSYEALLTRSDIIPEELEDSEEMHSALVTYRDACHSHVKKAFRALRDALRPANVAEISVDISGRWLQTTRSSLVGMLALSQRSTLPYEWKEALVSAAISLVKYQQACRLLCFGVEQRYSELSKELQNNNIDLQNLSKFPDWLLIQIENDFRARPVQIQIAREMISPLSGNNSLLQLNMGEGKSSVIIPFAAASLADRDKLVRVIVLKSLATQMFQLLVKRLTGLADRRVFYLPFSRQVKINDRSVRLIHQLYEACKDEGGILVTQPEHSLSFMLMSMNMVISPPSDNSRLANDVLALERFIKTNSRDLIDESDEIFHPRYALIYTLGQQQALQGHPHRWRIIMQLFSLVMHHAPDLRRAYPDCINLEVSVSGASRFPRLSILPAQHHEACTAALVERVANDVMNGKLEVHFRSLAPDVRTALKDFISNRKVDAKVVQKLHDTFKDDGTWCHILLLRGMLACGVLIYALKNRRWRVDYGLDRKRSLLAVPYRAKDVPSLRSEFGHPDVAIALTCLSYYYEGLRVDDISLCVDALFQLDSPELEYATWIHDAIPSSESIRDVRGINVDDSEQLHDILWPTFRFNRYVIDFYMNHFVFPKAAKDFPHKLSSSGWDLAEKKTHPTTGFSGTNDNRYLLPISIQQLDQDEQRTTNALVLSYLLQPENTYNLWLPTKTLLEDIVSKVPKIRALLDVGAQMLEFCNKELAWQWLQLEPDPKIQAAVYFNDSDELTVITRDGTVEDLNSSPFLKRLDQCLVYLDDAHTRGTDLKLPISTRAAVTLGRKVTKDRLVQGCMRLRQLGHGQSVSFVAPPDIDRRIRQMTQKKDSDSLDVGDVLHLAMTETWEDIEHNASLWAQQGLDHRRRKKTADELFSATERHADTDLSDTWIQPEARSLEELYNNGLSSSVSLHDSILEIPEFKDRLEIIGGRNIGGPSMDEEQEREVSHEAEVERQQERPGPSPPAFHTVHEDMKILVERGIFRPSSAAFIPLFDVLKTIPHFSRLFQWSRNLFATEDFAVTIRPETANQSQYLKPVRWILSVLHQGSTSLIVLSPYEVNELLPLIRKQTRVNLHLYCPRVTRDMPTNLDLRLYTIHPMQLPLPPRILLSQLHLFAGQLYLPDQEVYAELCDSLGLSLENGGFVNPDGFVAPDNRHRTPAIQQACSFDQSPVPFLREMIGLRRKGNSYAQTHMGRILGGRVLSAEDF